MVHANPGPATLAGVTGVSRAALARRFTELVGEPPMTYLASWRLALAADLLRDTDATIGTLARRVGYGSPFASAPAIPQVPMAEGFPGNPASLWNRGVAAGTAALPQG